jgi:hypothetical protein
MEEAPLSPRWRLLASPKVFPGGQSGVSGEILNNKYIIIMGFGEPRFPGNSPIGPRAQKRDETSEEYRVANPQFAAAREDTWRKKMQEAGVESEDRQPTPEQQKAQQEMDEASQMVADHFKGAARIPDGILTPEETQILSQMEVLYTQQKAANPDQPVKFGLDDQSNETYMRLLYRLPLAIREHGDKQIDQAEMSEIREQLGIQAPKKEEASGSKIGEIKKYGEQDKYENIGKKIPLDEKNVPSSEIWNISYGNMFKEGDQQTLAGKIIGENIYNKLVYRTDHQSQQSAQELIQLGKEGLDDFKQYVENINNESRQQGGKEFPFNTTRQSGETGFHLNGQEGNVSRGHLFYFNKSSIEWKNPHEQQVRAYLTLKTDEIKNVQRYFVDLSKKLYDEGIDFSAKAASPNGMEKRTDNVVLYISASDQAKAGKIIKEFLSERKIGQGNVDAAIPSPDQEGLSWALEPTEQDVKLWQDVSGSSERVSYNGLVAVKAAPAYLRRIAEIHLKSGNQNEAAIFSAEADRVEDLIKHSISQ